MTDDLDTALRRAVAAGVYAASYGFDWQRPTDALDKVAEEVGELREALAGTDDSHIDEELGDLLFAVCNVARMVDCDPESLLHAATSKFERRFSFVLDTVAADGLDPRAMSLDELEAVWQRSKSE